MTESDRIRKLPMWSPASLALALVLLLVLAVAGLHSELSGQYRLAQWRIPGSQVRWIPSATPLLARNPTEGEAIYGTGLLPLGNPSGVQIFHQFTSAADAPAAMAILTPAIDGEARVYVNFAPLKESFTSAGPGFAHPASRSALWDIPQDHILRGRNRIDIVVSGTARRALAAPIYLGPKAELLAAAQGGSRTIALARQIVLALALLALAVNLAASAARSPHRHLVMAAGFAACATRIYLAETGAEQFGLLWLAIDCLLLAGTAICAALAFREEALPARWAQRGEGGWLLAIGIGAAITLRAAIKGSQGAACWGAALTVLLGLAYLIWAIARAIPRAAAPPPRIQVLNGSVACLCLISAVIAAICAAGVILPGPPYGLEVGLAAALCGLALLASGWGFIAFIQAMRVRLDQAQTIRRQQAELKAASLALEEKTRQSALLEERQRMARDVHDGIGGQLASLIAQVRMRRISMDHVEKALVGGLSELRFLVSSLDVMGESLADALATFLDRAQQQVAAAGMTLEWSQTCELAVEIREPQWILNLYRLLQEAVTNAVRHSGGDRISVSISDRDKRIVVVRIEDNGSGIDPAAIVRGRGLANMERRARDLGGSFNAGPAREGAGLCIEVEAAAPR